MNYRKKAFTVYANECAECGHTGSDDNPLEVHHVDLDRTNNDLVNLRVLCHNCHIIEHKGVTDVVKRSISFRTDQVAAIWAIASEDKHGKFSRVVQEAVDDLIERREQAEQKAEAA